MNDAEYRSSLLKVLAAHSEHAGRQFRLIIENLPSEVRSVDFEVFPGQEGDGAFSIRAEIEGPNLYTLNKSIALYADIFDTKYTETGFDRDIPMLDPFDTTFSVNDAIVDCAAQWLKDVWQTQGDLRPGVPVTVVGHDDYGTITPLVLHK